MSPATYAAALVPRPPLSGMSERMRNSNPSTGCRAVNPRTARLRWSRAIFRSVCTAKRPVSTTSSSMCRARAQAMLSKPGPRFADEAGTRTSRRRSMAASLIVASAYRPRMHRNITHFDEVEAIVIDRGPLQGRRYRLGAAAGLHGTGLSRYVLGAGERAMPVHVHADEEEIFHVLAGSGFSWQDGRTYAVGAGD